AARARPPRHAPPVPAPAARRRHRPPPGGDVSHGDTRGRLAAVESIDWSKVERESDAEYYGDWLHIGPVRLATTFSPGPEDLADVAQTQAVAAFVQHAAGDLRRLLADLDHASTTRGAIMPESNPCYGPPAEGEPVRLLADAVEVLRPNGQKVAMDLVALADVVIKADRAVAALREENAALRERVEELERRAGRAERAGRMLA